jgi:hypothetical protein
MHDFLTMLGPQGKDGFMVLGILGKNGFVVFDLSFMPLDELCIQDGNISIKLSLGWHVW